GFLLLHAPLEPWEADVLGIIREEAYYFLPQRQTKIMNEGWATYWHSKLMTTRALRDDEVIDDVPPPQPDAPSEDVEAPAEPPAEAPSDAPSEAPSDAVETPAEQPDAE